MIADRIRQSGSRRRGPGLPVALGEDRLARSRDLFIPPETRWAWDWHICRTRLQHSRAPAGGGVPCTGRGTHWKHLGKGKTPRTAEHELHLQDGSF